MASIFYFQSEKFCPPVEDTIRTLLVGGEPSFEHYRSLIQKKALLARAIEINDGNSILAVRAFLRRLRAIRKVFDLLLSSSRSHCSSLAP